MTIIPTRMTAKIHPQKNIACLVKEGRFSYPCIPSVIHAETRSLLNPQFQAQEELTRAKKRIVRYFSIYFPEYKGVYRDLKAVSGRGVLQVDLRL